jgi:hypothetical protein
MQNYVNLSVVKESNTVGLADWSQASPPLPSESVVAEGQVFVNMAEIHPPPTFAEEQYEVDQGDNFDPIDQGVVERKTLNETFSVSRSTTRGEQDTRTRRFQPYRMARSKKPPTVNKKQDKASQNKM